MGEECVLSTGTPTHLHLYFKTQCGFTVKIRHCIQIASTAEIAECCGLLYVVHHAVYCCDTMKDSICYLMDVGEKNSDSSPNKKIWAYPI